MASEAAVSFVVGKLGDLLIEEARLLYDVRDQFEWIVGELRRMQCFLKDADAKQKEDERVRNWVTEIRDVSYDAEDVIDTFILTQTAQTSRRTRRRLFLRVKRYICIVSELITRHRVATKIQHIKMKIGDISSSLQTYGIRDINDGGQETRLNIRRRSHALYEEPDLIGMQESMTTLKEQLVNEEARRFVISIVGMGGSGLKSRFFSICDFCVAPLVHVSAMNTLAKSLGKRQYREKPVKTVRVMIKGRVQGVFYLDWTVENARELRIKGWVRYRRDGSVEALFSGDPNSVQEMKDRCRRGPPAAMVTALDVVPSDENPGDGFDRRPTV